MKNYEIHAIIKGESSLVFDGQAEDMLEVLKRWVNVLENQKKSGRKLPILMEIYEVL